MGALISETVKVSVTDDTVDPVRDSCSRSPNKSIRQVSNELQILHSKVHDIIHKWLHLPACKFQLL